MKTRFYINKALTKIRSFFHCKKCFPISEQKSKSAKSISTQPANSVALTIALCGNPNCGKTTLFNALTGANQKVGNWPGVTVEQKVGVCNKDKSIKIADTPGVYSLTPFSPDEKVTLDYLLTGNADVIVNVVDSTNLERNLFLTTQLAELSTPLVVALNMQDEAAQKGISIDAALLSEKLHCVCVPISAAKKQGLDKLLQTVKEVSKRKSLQKLPPFKYSPAIETTVEEIQKIIAPTQYSRWVLLKLAENDDGVKKLYKLTKQQQEKIDAARLPISQNIAVRVTEERYDKISEIVSKAQKISPKQQKQGQLSVTEKLDKIFLNKWLAFPIFALVMTTVFYFSVGGLGGFLTGLINDRFTPLLKTSVSDALTAAGAKEWVRSLAVDGIIDGVMSVVGFVPQIMLLFGFIAILEGSGYMSRIAFITDRLLNKIGLGGRSFVSIILGCGCSVPAIMSARTIKNTAERNTTITLTPFVPCSAKLAVISFFTSFVLGGNALFAVSFYFLGVLTIICGGKILQLLRREKASDTFIMELPTYRAPSIQSVLRQMWERGKAFLAKAGTIIFAASVLLWLTTHFNLRFQPSDTSNSILASLGKVIAPVFYPLGWNDGGYGWQFAISTLTGIAAKETVVTTLQILLPQSVGQCISPIGAYSFVAYNLLTVPCVAAISASFTEQDRKSALKAAAFQLVISYAVSVVIYNIGKLAQMHNSAFKCVVALLAVGILSACIVKTIIANKKDKKQHDEPQVRYTSDTAAKTVYANCSALCGSCRSCPRKCDLTQENSNK